MTGFIAYVFRFPNRVSLKGAFEVLEPDEGKPSCPVLRGPGPSNGAWLPGASWFARHPGLPYRCAAFPAQGSRDFYPRATTRTVTSTGIGMLAV
jgi:hypothetical protein